MVGFQVEDGDACFDGMPLQLFEEAPSQSQTAGTGSDPHALDLRWSVGVQLQGAAAHRLLSQLGQEQQTGGRHELVGIRLDAASGIESPAEALVQLGEVLLDAPAGTGAGGIRNVDLYQGSDQQSLYF